MIICDICDQNVSKSVLLKKLPKILRNRLGHKFEIVSFCDNHKCHSLPYTECDLYKPCFCFCLESGSERLWAIRGNTHLLLCFHEDVDDDGDLDADDHTGGVKRTFDDAFDDGSSQEEPTPATLPMPGGELWPPLSCL